MSISQIRKMLPLVALAICTLIGVAAYGLAQQSLMDEVPGKNAELSIVQLSPKSILVNNIGESAVNLTASIPVGNKTLSLPMFSLMPSERIELHLGNGTIKMEKPVMNQTGIYFQEQSMEDKRKEIADKIITQMALDGKSSDEIGVQQRTNEELLGTAGEPDFEKY
ncbi:MAG: hypothetical protein MUO26_14485 [Methanotrichaceae archaeon]|nr:hypothetical protein [Methanotrichaceae archaeon]